MPKDPIASGILDILTEKGLIQGAVAQRAGFSGQQFNNMLHGRQIIKAVHIIPISRALGVSVSDIYSAGEKYAVGVAEDSGGTVGAAVSAD